MAAAAEKHYLDALELEPSRLLGIATTRHGHGVPTRRIRVVEAGHPMPDQAGLKGAEDTLRLAQTAEADDLLLVLLSGGGSANCDRAGRGHHLRAEAEADPGAAAFRRADRRGQHRPQASVADQGRAAGTRRPTRRDRHARHLGRAARRSVRDRLGADRADPTTLADARAIVAKYRLDIDDAIRRALENPANESCKPGDAAFARARFELIARPRQSLDAAITLARDAGYETIDLGADLEGEAREVAADHARLALDARAKGKRIAILSGGELTVTVRGNGRGGPNQEYALALADLLKDTPGIAALAGDTNSTDGGAGSASDPAGR